MLLIGRESLQSVASQLKQALYNHDQWHKDIIRTIVCGLNHDQRDVAPDAHMQCRFGQWYYSDVTRELREHQAFAAMEFEHKRMHQIATRMLQEIDLGRRIEVTEYDNFASALDRLRLELMSLNREIDESLYRIDTLTGAENRTGMLATLREMQALIRRMPQSCTLAMLDLDHFKNVNDTYGHLVGDEVLAGSVRVIRGILRPYDRIFRFGGEEFLIVLPYTDITSGWEITERLRKELADTVLTTANAAEVKVTTSIGLAELDATLNVELSIDRADQAMFAAKKAGRNRICTWDASMEPATDLPQRPVDN
ncbi:diguanylate cyclase [Oleiagrimonas soli]|uniref:diguanylate cyclase n=1 Tax=Oleiagrimonas soli TaxID=1543381 RepID=A0A841KGI8_9GAMM|nr:diguanylate cyclase [Oleiagrimonas soli]MBB6182839.1 diguanylate cyclase (GGDEF)-like protein [Oleiagrimonas soli]